VQIQHHIALRLDDERQAAFREAGIELKKAGIMTAFEITEDDPRWQKVLPLTHKFKVFDTVTTKFSAAELTNAGYLGMAAAGHHGYPEPSDDNGYLQATFDLSEYCRTCGTGLKQIAPFRLKKTPKLGKSLLQLNWILDEYFVTPELWKDVFEPLGIGHRPVVLHKTGAVLDSVVQLEIPHTHDLQVDGLSFSVCPACSRKKYSISFRGFFPPPSGGPEDPMFKSSQYFGPGALAYKLVLVSGALYRKVKDAGVRGINFYPCAR
jgi:hypothetical protein